MDLVADVYKATADFPKEEKYWLISQMRRSAVSVPSNIAEGAGRNSDKEFCHFLATAHGSSYELETQVTLSQKLGLLSAQISNELSIKINEFQKMNYSLQLSLNPELENTSKSTSI